MYGTSGRKGIEQIFVSLDFDSRVLRDDDYITELFMLPYWGLCFLSIETGVGVSDAEIDNAWSVMANYLVGQKMEENYYYEYNEKQWVGFKFYQPSTETDPYTGAIYCHVNIR